MVCNQVLNPGILSCRLSHPASAKRVSILSCRGFTLIELIIVVLIMSIVAVIAVPYLPAGNLDKLTLAAEEVASAMRYARSESIRLGSPLGFRQESAQKRIRVFRGDTGTNPIGLVYDIYHPLSKNLYDIDLNTHAFAEADALSDGRIYRGTCNDPENVYFDASGTPWCANPGNILLEQFEVKLVMGPHMRVVTLHGITGRVTVQ